MNLPPLISWQEIHARLIRIFPDGTPDRGYLVREATARTIFTALYVGAIEGADVWIAPRHVVRMGDTQAARRGDARRTQYYTDMNVAGAPSPADRWYAENTREPLRDEVIRQGLVPANAMVERIGLPTTSPRGRYALRAAFAAMFHPELDANAQEEIAAAWRARALSAAALARTALVRASAGTSSANILVQCPGGPSIILPPGPSPVITKAVVEVFAPKFLGDPRVAWVSDSASKTTFRDAPLEKALDRIMADRPRQPDGAGLHGPRTLGTGQATNKHDPAAVR